VPFPFPAGAATRRWRSSTSSCDRCWPSTDRRCSAWGLGPAGWSIRPGQGIGAERVNLDLTGLPLRPVADASVPLPVYLANDSQAAALAEVSFFGGSERANMPLSKVGQALRLLVLRGDCSWATVPARADIGHMMVVENGGALPCGHNGLPGDVASTRAGSAARSGAGERGAALAASLVAPEALALEASALRSRPLTPVAGSRRQCRPYLGERSRPGEHAQPAHVLLSGSSHTLGTPCSRSSSRKCAGRPWRRWRKRPGSPPHSGDSARRGLIQGAAAPPA